MARRTNGEAQVTHVDPLENGTGMLPVPDHVQNQDAGAITEDMLLEKARETLYRVLEKAIENPATMGAIAADIGKIVFDRANQVGAGGVPYESRVKRRA